MRSWRIPKGHYIDTCNLSYSYKNDSMQPRRIFYSNQCNTFCSQWFLTKSQRFWTNVQSLVDIKGLKWGPWHYQEAINIVCEHNATKKAVTDCTHATRGCGHATGAGQRLQTSYMSCTGPWYPMMLFCREQGIFGIYCISFLLTPTGQSFHWIQETSLTLPYLLLV